MLYLTEERSQSVQKEEKEVENVINPGEAYRELFEMEMKETGTVSILRCRLPIIEMKPAMATTKNYLQFILKCLEHPHDGKDERLSKKRKLARSICRLDKALNAGLIGRKYDFRIEADCNEVIRTFEDMFNDLKGL